MAGRTVTCYNYVLLRLNMTLPYDPLIALLMFMTEN
jgi:hypothetical protein